MALVISLVAAALIALICAVFCHIFIQGRLPANFAATVYTVLVFHGLAYMETGQVDPNWFVTTLVVSVVSLPVVLLAGSLVRRWKTREKSTKE